MAGTAEGNHFVRIGGRLAGLDALPNYLDMRWAFRLQPLLLQAFGFGLGFFFQLPAIAFARRHGVSAAKQDGGRQSTHGAAQMRLPTHPWLLWQDAEHHAAIEQEGQHPGGNRGAVAANQSQCKHQKSKAMGDAAGTQMILPSLPQEPCAQSCAQPNQRQTAQRGAWKHAACQGTQHQYRHRIGGQMFDAAMQKRRSQDAPQAGRQMRTHAESACIKIFLREKYHRQQQYRCQSKIECPQYAATIPGALLGGVGNIVLGKIHHAQKVEPEALNASQGQVCIHAMVFFRRALLPAQPA